MKILSLALGLALTLACAVAPAWAAPISIRVVGPDNQLVPNSTVQAVRAGYQIASAPLQVTGADGQFSLDWNGALPTEEQLAAKPGLWVRAGASGLATQALLITASHTTIHLSAGRAWGGVVLDKSEKPVAGVRVMVYGWRSTPTIGTAQGSFTAVDPAWEMGAVTDDQGRWQIADLPVSARFALGLEGPRVARSAFNIERDEADAPPLFAELGATITGRLLRPDGQPLAGAPVEGQFLESDGEPVKTDAKGRFTLAGLNAGAGTLVSHDWEHPIITDPGFLVPYLTNVAARAGQTTDVGAWKARRGVAVTAQIVDAQTRKPIAGAKFRMDSNNLLITSDASGQIRARALPEAVSEYDNDLGRLSAPNYVAKTLKMPTGAANASAINLGVVMMQRGVTPDLSLRLRGEVLSYHAGVPTISLQKGAVSHDLGFWSDAHLAEPPVLAAGVYKVVVKDHNGNEDAWRLVSPLSVTIPAPGAPRPKIEIVIARQNAAPAPLSEVRGRVLDEKGNGVAGALVNAGISAGNFTSAEGTISNRDGSFVFRGSYVANPIGLAISRPGYEAVGESVTKFEGDVAYVSGITLKRR